ncbi:MAG: uridylate kinase [Christensenellales bacterium]|jgi:glutamate 5-kinase
MAAFDVELVGKIGSMALIRREDNEIDYNRFSKLGKELRPGIVWVSSGAVEIGRLDYMKRMGKELEGSEDDMKTDYAAQGQAILMQNYRNFIHPSYSVRQVLVEHQHFNDVEKREHIRRLLLRCPAQNAIPIINYNDPVSADENRKLELAHMRSNRGDNIVECIDNDETAAVVASLVKAKTLLILTSVKGIYSDPNDESTLINEICGKDTDELLRNVHETERFCVGSSRQWSGGAKSKLKFAAGPLQNGTTVIIAYAGYSIRDILAGNVERTWMGVR